MPVGNDTALLVDQIDDAHCAAIGIILDLSKKRSLPVDPKVSTVVLGESVMDIK